MAEDRDSARDRRAGKRRWRTGVAVAVSALGVTTVLTTGTAHAAGGAAFAPAQFYDTFAGGPFFIRAVDINGDGKPDIVTCDSLQGGWGGLSVLINHTEKGAAGTDFSAPFNVPGVPLAFGCNVADVNGDGKPDLIATDASKLGVGGVVVMLNHTENGSDVPSFGPPQYFAGGLMPAVVAAADINNDGRLDLIVGDTANVVLGTTQVLMNTTAPGSDTVTFSGPFFFNGGITTEGIAAADINGDGKTDLAIGETSSSTVTVLMNFTADGAPVPDLRPTTYFFPFATWVGLADMNNDGKPDLMSDVGILGNPLAGMFSSVNRTPLGSPVPDFPTVLDGAQAHQAGGWATENTAIADFDGDGKPDAVLASPYLNPRNQLSLLRNRTPDGAPALTFDPPALIGDAGWTPNALDTADFNGDGKPDLVAGAFLAVTGRGSLAVLLNTSR
ncbi:FG-GAP repeat domain-containing protein [Nocardia terrae]|uniref:FG-GAP repeat domain-containing protein n=1 Tax=Nocardia terrae TaxID=2675851 RepID=UPI0018E01983|nr:VCBS repeat-containing protein [Nocardia terrae]